MIIFRYIFYMNTSYQKALRNSLFRRANEDNGGDKTPRTPRGGKKTDTVRRRSSSPRASFDADSERRTSSEFSDGISSPVRDSRTSAVEF